MSMKQYIFQAANRAAMMDALRAVGLTFIDADSGVEHYKFIEKGGWSEITAIVSDAVEDDSTEPPTITTPQVVKEGFWLMLYVENDVAAVEGLAELRHKCDMSNAEAEHDPLPNIMLGIKSISGAPSGCDCSHLTQA